MNSKAANLALITVAQVLALSLWFAGTAAGPGIAREAVRIGPGYQALLTGAVQAGFVLGTLASAILALPDRYDPRRVFAAAALLGALSNAAILAMPAGADAAIAARFATGMALAGVYPVGMKLAAGWADRGDTGLVVGLLVGGLTLGSASPHLTIAAGGLHWPLTLGAASLAAVLAAGMIGLTRLGPRHASTSRFDPGAALRLWRNRGTRLATLGYLGHMWELYAMWAWVGLYLAASFAAWDGGARAEPAGAALATFCVIAIGGLGCVAAGLLADRLGRVRITVAAMAVSAACCLLAGPAFGLHPAVTTTLCLVWGIAVVADSAQFSASVAELSEPGLTGTMLTIQNSLGFALTLVTIHVMPMLVEGVGWSGAFAFLAIGPLLGCIAMLRLGRSPLAARLAGGRG
ncbi:MFS transporter [Roseomonas marmotae]|uniref:MFS transporter n=1 Tax=Roseomonas marmotae TaxID=2768161 RepID=A0ABS3KC91_9PROT|nr:MFS transporter [Roseomonas marmotae]MBO1074597.1 MFS transporter [Roseomonas marmotae]QTI81624.1 MFS transporter [Roseomonas marmotae]